MSKPTIAIAGATGHVGRPIVAALLDPANRPAFERIVVLARHASADGPEYRAWAEAGAEVRRFDDADPRGALDGIDVLVTTIGPRGHALKERLLREAVREGSGAKLKLYVPSEFGADHYRNEWAHNEWEPKRKHFELARELAPQLKVCRVFAGLFIEDSFGPWFGIDSKAGRYECVAPKEARVSLTGLDDVGRAVAALAQMAPADVPDKVYLGGDTVSIAEAARIMGEAAGAPIEVVEVPMEPFKSEAIAKGGDDPCHCLRFMMAMGRIEHSKEALGNDNEVVNPGESKWKWKTVKDYAEETGGRPHKDIEWSV